MLPIILQKIVGDSQDAICGKLVCVVLKSQRPFFFFFGQVPFTVRLFPKVKKSGGGRGSSSTSSSLKGSSSSSYSSSSSRSSSSSPISCTPPLVGYEPAIRGGDRMWL